MLVNNRHDIRMEDYLGRILAEEMQSSKIIDEVNLFCNRPMSLVFIESYCTLFLLKYL